MLALKPNCLRLLSEPKPCVSHVNQLALERKISGAFGQGDVFCCLFTVALDLVWHRCAFEMANQFAWPTLLHTRARPDFFIDLMITVSAQKIAFRTSTSVH